MHTSGARGQASRRPIAPKLQQRPHPTWRAAGAARSFGQVVLTLGLVLAVAGCKQTDESATKPQGSQVHPAPSEAPKPPKEPSAKAPAPPQEPSAVPAPVPAKGYQVMTVMRVVATTQGNAVLLVTDGRDRIVPIFVGGTEALSIELRHQKHRYPRPLTHDLLDSLVNKLGGHITKVHVDDIKDDVFVGRVYVQRGQEVINVDARPSDAIALALGARAPIFVAEQVIERAGIRPEDIKSEEDALPKAPRRLPEITQL